MRDGPWGPPAPPPPPPAARPPQVPVVVVVLALALSLLLAGRPADCSCREGAEVAAAAAAARMGLDGDGPPDAAAAGHNSNSENGRFTYGVASSPGKRASMEDFSEARIDDVDGEKVGMFGVYDGHGGVRAAEYVKQHLFSNLIKHPKFITDTRAAISETYNQTDSEFLKADSSQARDAGSTASTAIIFGDRLLVANVGDSRAVICKGGQAIAVSRDHKPDQSDERERIENAGGFVMWAGTWRVGGVLAVSRAFGDKLLKQYVVADPEIKEEVVDSSLEFLILASDGLWDVVTNEEAVDMVKPIQDPQEAANKLLDEASRRGSSDNITVVIVRFLDGTTTGDKSGEEKEKEKEKEEEVKEKEKEKEKEPANDQNS